MLRPEAPTAAFDKLCQEALQYRFLSVCVNSGRVACVARKLQGSGVKVCSVVGFPLGAMTSRSKAFETRQAIEDGASEIDMVINVLTALPIDAHLMIENPDQFIEKFAAAGATHISVHAESAMHLNRSLQLVRSCGAHPGLPWGRRRPSRSWSGPWNMPTTCSWWP